MIRSLPAYLALGGILASGAAGYLLYQQVQANGRLEARLDQAMEANVGWQERMDELEARWDTIDRLDAELAEIRREQQASYQRLQTDLGRLRDELPEVREWTDTPVPTPLLDSLCQRDALAGNARQRLCGPDS